MPKVDMIIFINTDNPNLFIRLVKAICWVFGDRDLPYIKSPYSITHSIEEKGKF